MPKQVIWYKQQLDKPLQVACSLGQHILTVDSVIMIGVDAAAIPYAFCPEHKAYFAISSDVNMDNMVLKLEEDPVEMESDDKS